ncbi:MAG: phosphotransferase [Acidimicrobiia bacterium]|nr:phosphotransferase [Acidimicrobiia bacterium]
MAIEYIGFPPGKHYLTLPARNRDVATGGLALYDATFLHQRFAMAVGRRLLRFGIEWPFRLRYQPPVPDWWDRWIEDVAEPAVGAVAATAFRLPGLPDYAPRITALLFDGNGQILAFAKHLVRDEPSDLSITAQELLTARPAGSFHIPALLAHGRFEDMAYQMHAPLPSGGHRQPEPEPTGIERVIDELQSRLAALPRAAGTPEHYVPVHRDFLAINLRRGADGHLWLIDWDNVGWGPPLTDELAFWMGGVARRFGRTGIRQAEHVLRLLRRRGSDGEIREAIEWRLRHQPREALSGEQRIRDGVWSLLK